MEQPDLIQRTYGYGAMKMPMPYISLYQKGWLEKKHPKIHKWIEKIFFAFITTGFAFILIISILVVVSN